MNSGLRMTLAMMLLLGAGGLSNASLAEAQERQADARGFIYGRITTRGDSVYEGRLRWGKEEAFWNDFFNSAKENLPHLEDIPRKERRRRESIEVFGIPIGVNWSDGDDNGRQLVARFGDLRRIEVGRGERAKVVLKSGAGYEVKGGSNDLEEDTEISVWDRGAGEIRVPWDQIRTIEFHPAPAGLTVADFRLRGTVHTDDGSFQGDIQWDQDECLSSDELDGETRDGEVSLQMGQIRSIERRSRDSSKVVLRDGRTFVLDGTNDVDSGNRGIYVNDERFGRVLVNWSAFRRVEFDPPGPSGPAYTDFRPGGPLFGTVKTRAGQTWSGRLIYDVDEAETTEFLDGHRNDVEYSIPFARIAFIIPEKSDSSRVVLKDGRELKLEDTVDVGRDNAGMLVFERGWERPRYIAWEDVERVDFD